MSGVEYDWKWRNIAAVLSVVIVGASFLAWLLITFAGNNPGPDYDKGYWLPVEGYKKVWCTTAENGAPLCDWEHKFAR